MLLGLRAVGASVAHVFTHVFASVTGNLVAAVLSIPFILAVGVVALSSRSFSLLPLGVALFVGVLPNPCTAGVHVMAHELATGGYLTFSDYWEGLRRYARPAGFAWLLSFAVTVVILGNMAFYAHSAGYATGTLRAVGLPLFLLWLFLLVIWISIHLYVFPLLIEQEVKNIRLVYRNAALMVIGRPSVVAIVMPVWIFVLTLSSITGVVTFLGLALCASIQHNTTSRLLPTFRLSEAR